MRHLAAVVVGMLRLVLLARELAVARVQASTAMQKPTWSSMLHVQSTDSRTPTVAPAWNCLGYGQGYGGGGRRMIYSKCKAVCRTCAPEKAELLDVAG